MQHLSAELSYATEESFTNHKIMTCDVRLSHVKTPVLPKRVQLV